MGILEAKKAGNPVGTGQAFKGCWSACRQNDAHERISSSQKIINGTVSKVSLMVYTGAKENIKFST